MQSIRPRTYNELMCYRRCLSLREYIPECDDAMIERLYRFLQEDPSHRILLRDRLLLMQKGDEQVDAVPLKLAPDVPLSYESILLTASVLNISRPYRYFGDGDGGSSGNNNNNNNNNNNG